MFFFICFLLGKLFAIITGGYNYKRMSIPYRITFFVVILAIFCEVYGYYISMPLPHKSNVWLFNWYIMIEAIMVGIAAVFLVNNKRMKLFFSFLIVVNFIYWVVIMYTQNKPLLVSTSIISGCIMLSFMYIVILSNNSFITKNIATQPVFWLCISTIIFFGCDIPCMGLYNYTYETMTKSLAHKLATIHTILDIIRYPLLGVSFLLFRERKTSSLKVA